MGPSVTRTTSLVRALVLALVALPALVVGAASAAVAHDVLISTSPADGSTLDAAPDSVVLTFDQPAMALGTEIVVHGPDGATVSTGKAVLLNDTVSEALVAARPAGSYTVAWRVTSADGHPVSGTFTFTAAAATGGGRQTGPAVAATGPAASASGTPGPTPTADRGGRANPTLWLVAGAVGLLALVAIVVVVLLTRSDRTPPAPGTTDDPGR